MSAIITRLETLLVDNHLASRNDLQGCSASEIREVEGILGLTLPAFYVAFLQRMGRHAGGFMKGSSAFYPELLRLREYAEELLAEVGSEFRLGIEDFVFFVHQGYQFAYFRLGTGDDPGVWGFGEGWDAPRKMCGSLSAFFEGVANDEAREKRGCK